MANSDGNSSIIHRTIRKEMLINLVINCALNALCAYLIYKNTTEIPTNFWSLLIDTFLTCSFVGIISTLFGATVAKRYFTRGVYAIQQGPSQFFDDLPKAPWRLAIFLAGLGTIILVPGLGLSFMALGISSLPLVGYVLYKAIWGGLFGMLVTYAVQKRYVLCGRQ